SETSFKKWSDNDSETVRTPPGKESAVVSIVESESSRKSLVSRPSFLISKDDGKKSKEEDQSVPKSRKSQLWIDLKVLTFTAFGYKRHSTSQEAPSAVECCPESNFGSEGRRERERLVGGSTRKKKKISELRAFVETKLRSRSEKALEKIGTDESRRSSISEEQVGDIGENIWGVHRPHSALEKLEQPSVSSGPLSPFPLSQGLVKGKSMPSLRFVGSNQEAITETKAELTTIEPKQEIKELKSTLITAPAPPKVKRPIITVTQHTPSPSEYGWRDQVGLSSVLASCAGHIPIMLSQTGSIESHPYHYFHKPPIPLPLYRQPQSAATQDTQPQVIKPPLARSHTDSDIQYPCQETAEVPGTSHFVTREGHINLKVLLSKKNSKLYFIYLLIIIYKIFNY
ncbi:Protein unc-80-like protein, partial [Armadillidium vulgare]